MFSEVAVVISVVASGLAIAEKLYTYSLNGYRHIKKI
jgi:hypothetical protein